MQQHKPPTGDRSWSWEAAARFHRSVSHTTLPNTTLPNTTLLHTQSVSDSDTTLLDTHTPKVGKTLAFTSSCSLISTFTKTARFKRSLSFHISHINTFALSYIYIVDLQYICILYIFIYLYICIYIADLHIAY